MAMGSTKKKSSPSLTYRRHNRAAPRRRGLVALMLVCLVVVGAAAASQVWTRLRSIDSGYKLSGVSAENARLLQINRQLKVELALLKNPARIKRIATGKLGMAPPQPHQVRKLVDRSRQAGEGDRRLARVTGRNRNGS